MSNKRHKAKRPKWIEPRLHNAWMIDNARDVNALLNRCDCPISITDGQGMLTIEHFHVANCPALRAS